MPFIEILVILPGMIFSPVRMRTPVRMCEKLRLAEGIEAPESSPVVATVRSVWSSALSGTSYVKRGVPHVRRCPVCFFGKLFVVNVVGM